MARTPSLVSSFFHGAPIRALTPRLDPEVTIPVQPSRQFPEALPERGGRAHREYAVPSQGGPPQVEFDAVFFTRQKEPRFAHETGFSDAELAREKRVPALANVIQDAPELLLSSKERLVLPDVRHNGPRNSFALFLQRKSVTRHCKGENTPRRTEPVLHDGQVPHRGVLIVIPDRKNAIHGVFERFGPAACSPFVTCPTIMRIIPFS